MNLNLKQIMVPPGNILHLKDISWKMFETLLEELGESRAAKLSYSKGILEIMTPLLEHEFDKKIIGRLVEILLEELNIEFVPAGSTTLKNEAMQQGVEPDECFYIQNEAVMRGKKRIDLTIDPPPDLAIEIEITSRTHLNNYEALGVPELWRYNGSRLQINVLQAGKYTESEISFNFPQIPQIKSAIPQYVEQSKTAGRNASVKAFRNWVREQL
ncbi:Uma2 family endonuclease [Microcoleus sp. FACHB-672]|uniref:Uma2 family endonuclease n=1 Tax=Microcoleus sp. FACHB-672 TaxID=2692825 RepID=UPI001685D5EF|nr:Uma2 family endonuclease [Microcoleus sp. FACHB-672]MBD2043506.1 Uma2 family endonuclease [Microcoleus sp. FACHB-672]